MSVEQNKELARRSYEAVIDGIRSGDMSALDRFAAPDIRDHDPDPGQGEGIEGVKNWFLEIGRAFPDLRIELEDLIAEGDKVVARSRFRGTHRGEFQGMPATGRQVDLQVIDILRFRDGKIVERWGLADNLGLMQQLGAVSA